MLVWEVHESLLNNINQYEPNTREKTLGIDKDEVENKNKMEEMIDQKFTLF